MKHHFSKNVERIPSFLSFMRKASSVIQTVSL